MKKGKQCAEGCQCQNCDNLVAATHCQMPLNQDPDAMREIAIEETSPILEEDIDDIMDLVFGEDAEAANITDSSKLTQHMKQTLGMLASKYSSVLKR